MSKRAVVTRANFQIMMIRGDEVMFEKKFRLIESEDEIKVMIGKVVKKTNVNVLLLHFFSRLSSSLHHHHHHHHQKYSNRQDDSRMIIRLNQ